MSALDETYAELVRFIENAGGIVPDIWEVPNERWEEVCYELAKRAAAFDISFVRGPHGGPMLAGVELRSSKAV